MNKLQTKYKSLTDQYIKKSSAPVPLTATIKDDNYKKSVMPNVVRNQEFLEFNLFDVTKDFVKRTPPPKLIRPVDPRTRLNSKCIEPPIITVKQNNNLVKLQAFDYLGESMILFKQLIDQNMASHTGHLNRSLDLCPSINKNVKKNKKRNT